MSMYENKRSNICGVEFISLAEAKVVSSPGSPEISVDGTWDPFGCSRVNFAEEQTDDGYFDVTLEISVTDTSPESRLLMNQWCNIYLLVKLLYSNGDARVVGSDDFPVVFGFSASGNPASYTLTYSGQQPEPAKRL